MKNRAFPVLRRGVALFLLLGVVFAAFPVVPFPARAADDEQETFITQYSLSADWIKKNGEPDTYAELTATVELPFLRQDKTPRDILFLVDVSKSMYDTVQSLDGKESTSPLYTMKSGMQSIGAQLDMPTLDDRMAIIAFSDEVNSVLDFTTDRGTFSQATTLLTTYGDGTDYCRAFTKAKELISARSDRTRPVTVIFITDGGDAGDPSQAGQALSDLSALGEVYGVQLGCSEKLLGSAKALYRADTLHEMKNVLALAYSQITQCVPWDEVSFRIPSAGNFNFAPVRQSGDYGDSTADASGIVCTLTDVPSGVTFSYRYELTLADRNTLKTVLPVNEGGEFSITSSLTEQSAPGVWRICELQRPRYTVTYDGNGNTGGQVPVDPTRYRPGTPIPYPDNSGRLEKVVDGVPYDFLGWKVKTPANTSGSDGYFYIHDDTVVEALWGNVSVSKRSSSYGDGAEPVLQCFATTNASYDGDIYMEKFEAFHHYDYTGKILTVTFLDRIALPSDPVGVWDVSEAKNGSVMAWLLPAEEDPTLYDLYIAGNGGVIANPNSDYLFGCTSRMGIPSGFFEYSFSRLKRINGLDKFDTSRVTSTRYMFRCCYALKELDLSGLDLSHVINTTEMFSKCNALLSIPVLPADLSAAANMSQMFDSCTALTSVDLSGWDTPNLENMSGMFSRCTGLTELPIPPARTDRVIDMSNMFKGCSALVSADLSGWDTHNVENMSSMFSGCTGLTDMPSPPEDTSKVTDMSNMFSSCMGLTSADLSGWDIHNVENMHGMFYFCKALTLIPASLDTSKVTDMGEMFGSCSALTSADLSAWDTSQVKNMSSMFYFCDALTELPLPPADTSKVTDMHGMFSYCSALTSADLSAWDTGNVKTMEGMFSYCQALTSAKLVNRNISQVTNLRGMFSNCAALTDLDLSQLDLSGVKDVGRMLYGCSSLTTIGTTVLTVAADCNVGYFQNGASRLPTISFQRASAVGAAALPAEVQAGSEEILPAEVPLASAAVPSAAIIDMGEIHSGQRVQYQLTVTHEGDNGGYSGDVWVRDPIPDHMSLEPDSIVIQLRRIVSGDGLDMRYRMKQAPKVENGVLSFCVTGLSTGTVLTVDYACTAAAASNAYQQFLNTASWEAGGVSHTTDTIRHWIGAVPATVYKVSYRYDGEIPAQAPDLPLGASYGPGETVTVAAPASMPGYLFQGWYYNGSENPAQTLTMPGSNVELVGRWTEAPEQPPETVKVTYQYRGTVPHDADALPAERTYEKNSRAFLAPQPTSDISTFDGWHCDDTDKVSAEELEAGSFDVGETDTVLYGTWTSTEYTVRYQYTGAVPEGVPALPAARKYPWGARVTREETPADTDQYTFSGWSTYAELGVDAPYAQFTMPGQDVIFFGSWSKKAETPPPTSPSPSPSPSIPSSPSSSSSSSSRRPSPTPTPTPTPSPAPTAKEAEHAHYVIGFPDGTFAPDANITRAEVATVIARSCLEGFVEGFVSGRGGDYGDTAEHWALSAISYCTEKGVFEGYRDNTFRPDRYITRQELATVVARLEGIKPAGALPFTDSAEIAAWALDGVYTAYENGWVKGYEDGSFRPADNITRAETVKILNGYLRRGVDGDGLKDMKEYVYTGAADNSAENGRNEYMTWADVPKSHWAYYEILEAANDHSYSNEGGETPLPERWNAVWIDEVWLYHVRTR